MRKSSVDIMSTPKSNWLAAAELGLISSSFSTIVSQLFAARLGRDVLLIYSAGTMLGDVCRSPMNMVLTARVRK